MQAFRLKTVLDKNGTLSINGLPFHKGEKVEVIIFSQIYDQSGECYPLQGKPVIYTDPYNSVAEDDWDVLK